jgi:hypothetical protein
MPNPTFRRWTADDIAKLKYGPEGAARGRCCTARSLGPGDLCEGAPAWNFVEGASPRWWRCRRVGYRLKRGQGQLNQLSIRH